MTLWLWIVGLIAIIWPIVLSDILGRHISNEINQTKIFYRDKDELYQLTHEISSQQIQAIHKILQEHDQFLAIIWLNSFGIDEKENFGCAELKYSFKIRPNWKLDAMESPGIYDILQRKEKFPWGEYAERLRR